MTQVSLEEEGLLWAEQRVEAKYLICDALETAGWPTMQWSELPQSDDNSEFDRNLGAPAAASLLGALQEGDFGAVLAGLMDIIIVLAARTANLRGVDVDRILAEAFCELNEGKGWVSRCRGLEKDAAIGRLRLQLEKEFSGTELNEDPKAGGPQDG